MVPFDDKSPFVTSGIRIGSPAMTSRGLKETEFVRIAHLIDRVLSQPDDAHVISTVKREVEAMCEAFPLYDFVTA